MAVHYAAGTPKKFFKNQQDLKYSVEASDLTSNAYLNKQVTPNYFPKRVLLKHDNARKNGM
jgi:hypothetical protein